MCRIAAGRHTDPTERETVHQRERSFAARGVCRRKQRYGVRATYAGGVWKEEEPLTVGMMYTFEHAEEPERTSQPDNRANEHSVDNILVQ